MGLLARRRCATLAALSLLGTPVAAVGGTFVESATLEHAGVLRYFDYFVPDGLSGAPVPLVIVLHGGTQSNDDLVGGPMGELKRLAELEGFAVIYPNGTSASGQSGPSGSFNWNDCRADAGPASTPADDVGFIAALIDWAEAEFDLDGNRIYAVGASNGGLMSYRLAFELADRIAAVGAIIANLPANSECPSEPGGPVSVLIMNGTADGLMPWNGGQVLTNRGAVLSAAATVDAWKSFLGTEAEPRVFRLPDADPGDGGNVELEIFCGGEARSGLFFYTVNGAGHTVPSLRHAGSGPVEALLGKQNHDVEAAAVIWRFFAGHPKDGANDALCGDGCVDAAEQCDDGAPVGADCCSPTCRLDPAGAPCLGDGSLCAVGACDGNGGCAGAAPATCSNPRRSSLKIKKGEDTESDKLLWKWSGETAGESALGDPTDAADYALCLYAGTSAALAAEAFVPAEAALWRQSGGGFRYKDPAAVDDGIQTIILKSGASTRSLLLKGRGANMPDPALPLALPVETRLVDRQNAGCWEAVYDGGEIKKNDATQVKASAAD